MNPIYETVEIIYEHFDNIRTTDDLNNKIKIVWNKLGEEKLNSEIHEKIYFGLWVCIYKINLSNEKEINKAEQHFAKLKKIAPRHLFFTLWNRSKYSTLANLILNTKHNNFELKINNTSELELLISSWRSIGINIDPRLFLKRVSEVIENLKLQNNKTVIEHCSEIIGPYSEYNNAFDEFYKHSEKLWINKLTKEEMKEEIIMRSNKKRPIIDGKYQRDHQLALLFKKYYRSVCIICGSNKRIEISHKIPLKLGHENYGFDLPFNMELCCHSCHKRYEEDFDSRYEKSEDKIQFLKETHEADIRNSVWIKHIDSKYYKVSEKPKYSGIVKCIKCLRRYTKVESCKACDGEVLPIEDSFFKVVTS